MPVKANFKELQQLREMAPKGTKDKIKEIHDLYKDKKIVNYETAYNAAAQLATRHKGVIKAGLKKYESITSKYRHAEPMTGRLTRPPPFTVRTGTHSRAPSYIEFTFSVSHLKRDDDGLETRNITQLINEIRARIESQMLKALYQKPSTKIRLRLKLDLVKMRPGFDGEQPEEQLSKQTIKTNPKRITKATISKVIDELSENLAAKFDLIGDSLEGSGWRIKRYILFAVDIFETRPVRGSSYIPTPAKYSNSQWG